MQITKFKSNLYCANRIRIRLLGGNLKFGILTTREFTLLISLNIGTALSRARYKQNTIISIKYSG